MLINNSCQKKILCIGKKLPLLSLLCVTIFAASGCNSFFHPGSPKPIKTSSGEKIDLNDSTIRQYVEEWHEAKPSIERLAKLETDLGFLLSEVSKMSDLNQMPGLASNQTGTAITTQVPSNSLASTTIKDQGEPQDYNVVPSSGLVNLSQSLCPEPFTNSYKKSMAFVSFPRMSLASSKLGALQQVEQHLPLLIGANLKNRHGMITPVYMQDTFANTNERSELATAAQALALARQNRVQYIVSGEIDDMSLVTPSSVERPGAYTKFMNGTHNLLNVSTRFDKRNRVFRFNLQVRDGITGQLVFNNQYQTSGKWQAPRQSTMGFGSPEFWSTDYGRHVQALVAKASDELADTLHCQPYLARVDSRPGQQQVVLQSGTNSGVRTGDAMDLYQLVYQPLTGEYQQYDTRMIKRDARVYITEVYPSHSIGRLDTQMLLNGQYLVKAQ